MTKIIHKSLITEQKCTYWGICGAGYDSRIKILAYNFS